MKKIIVSSIMLCSAMSLFSNVTYARDDRLHFPLADVLNSEEAKAKLSGKVKFYFGEQQYGKEEQSFGTFTSNKKTNAFNKSDKIACERSLLSTLISFDARALKEGGNAVVGIYNEYRNQVFKSETEYECGAGTFVAGVTLRGKVVKLAE